MRKLSTLLALGLVAGTLAASRPGWAVGPTVAFNLPPQDTTPSVFGSLPFPNDLYFDQGKPEDGDGTLLNAGLPSGAKMGLAAAVVPVNAAVVEDAYDTLDGFGTTSAVFFFFDGPLDVASLPASPVLTPAITDGVFCAEAATGVLVPITLKAEVDSRIPHVLAVQPVSGRPLKPRTRYTCVVRRSVTGGGEPVEPSSDFVAVRDGASANTDADDIYDPVLAQVETLGVPASEIAGMTVFTTESTVSDLETIRSVILPGQPVPGADFTSRPELVFSGAPALANLLGSVAHGHIAKVATGFYPSPRFQTPDPDGDGPLGDLPQPPTFATCLNTCETTDEAFTHDGGGNPVLIDAPPVPVTVVIPTGTPPAGGWPVVIQQHALGGGRDLAVRLGDAAAARGFATVGIDAVAHGYRFWDCTPAAPCAGDAANNFGGTAVPDGFADAGLAGYTLDEISGNLGLLQGFHNLLGVRDNLRQTVVDLFSLVRLIQGHSIDAALGAPLDPARIFYMGHSLGGLVGVDFVALEPAVEAAVLDAAGGDLVTRLFAASPRGAGSMEVADGVLGLDPANVADAYGIFVNLAQGVIDPADGVNAARYLLAPPSGTARSVVQVEALGDEEIPNASSEALAVAGGLQLFVPFVQDLVEHPQALPLVGTTHTVRANAAAGAATAALLQTAFATPDGALAPSTVTLVPGFPHWDEVGDTGELFPSLARGVRTPAPGVVDAGLAWFADVIANGAPGRFSYTPTPGYNPVQNADVPAGASVEQFFARSVDQGGPLATSEPTPDVTVAFSSNLVPTRVTVARSTLGTTAAAGDADVPPGPDSTVGTLGILPFFVTLQREIPGSFGADVTIAYSATEVAVAGITPSSPDEAALVMAAFQPGTCAVGGAACAEDADCAADGPCQGASYAALPTTVDTVNHRVTATIADVGTFAVVHPDVLLTGYRPPLIAGGGGAISDCRGEWMIQNANNTPFRDVKGRVSQIQSCTDGDVTCDADRTVNGTCHFRVGICFNYPDPILPLCSVGLYKVVTYKVSRPRPVTHKPIDQMNGQALVDVIAALGGVQTGKKLNLIEFLPPFSEGRCSAFADFRVDTSVRGRFGHADIHSMSIFDGGPLDAGGDHLKLRCYSAP